MDNSTSKSSHSELPIDKQIKDHGLQHNHNNNDNDDENTDELCWPDNDPSHPKNWSVGKKTFQMTVIISLEFWTTVISTSGVSAAKEAQTEYGIREVLSIFCFTSIYLFAQGAASMLLCPISESFGRKRLYVCSMFLFSALCVIVGAVPSIAGVVVGRFCSGFVSSIPIAISPSSIEDTETRVWLIFLWGCMANLALTIGPIYSVYITTALGWRWVFYIAAIVSFVLACFSCFLVESRPSQILKTRLARLNENTSSERTFKIDNPDSIPVFREYVTNVLIRPTRLFFTEPIVFLITVMAAFVFGQIYLLTEALPLVYEQAPLNFTSRHASLSFVSIAIGMVLNVSARVYDYYHLKKIKASGREVMPEDKVRMFSVGAPLLAIGLWWFAWTIPPTVPAPWPVSFLPLILVGFATNEFDCTLVGYLTDTYTVYSAFVYAPLVFLRSVMSGALPLFANQMYNGLGANVATTILACLATSFCVTPLLFLKYGQRIREKSRFVKVCQEAEKRIAGS